jgi:hypothetical protein
MSDPQKASLLDRVRQMATELKLEGEEAEKYVNQHMERAGWKRETNWTPPDGKDGSGDKKDGWF